MYKRGHIYVPDYNVIVSRFIPAPELPKRHDSKFWYVPIMPRVRSMMIDFEDKPSALPREPRYAFVKERFRFSDDDVIELWRCVED